MGERAEPAVWMEGELLPLSQARLPITDHAFSVGDAAFETIGLHGGEPIGLTRHLKRLRQTLGGLGIEASVSDGEIRRIIGALQDANGPIDWVRMTVTAGDGPFSSERRGGRPRLVVVSGEASHGRSSKVITVPWPRNERGALAGLKTTSYAENALAVARAKAAGADEAILANTRGELCEGTGTNVFLVLGGDLVTPPLSSGCLQGVVRDLVAETSDVTERPVPMAEVPEATEAFLTSSTRGVMPITSWDGRALGVGALTMAASDAYESLIARNPDP